MKNEFKPFIVAVYGSLRQGFGNHRVLKDSEYLGTFKTNDLFTMYSLGAFPYIKPDEKNGIPITVELYKVISDNIAYGLDCLEGYPSFYDKKNITIQNFETDLEIKTYFIERESESVIVESGDWSLFKKGTYA